MQATNSQHGLAANNRKFYWNPIKNFFEPITYDSNINIDESEFWHIKFFVNQFNELTDVGYITNINPIFGTYKDLKRDDARKLKVKILPWGQITWIRSL